MKNLFWIIQSVIIMVVYCCLLHFVFTFLSTWNSVALIPISIVVAVCCIVLTITLVAYIIRNYKHFECNLFD